MLGRDRKVRDTEVWTHKYELEHDKGKSENSSVSPEEACDQV